MNQEKIGKFILKLRKDKKMTQQELADKLNVTDRAVSHWENGRSIPDVSLFKSICEVFDISVNELITGEKLSKEKLIKQSDENIINTSNDKIIKYMKEHNNIIDIGDISDIVTIYDNYFHDLLLEKRDNTLLFTLPFPIDEELSKSTLRELLSYYIQISNDRLPYETTIKDREEMLHGISDIVNEKYGIDIIDRDGNITLSNVTGNIEEILDK